MLKKLPVEQNVETIKVLKKLASAHRALAELKGIVSTIPNENILINTLGLQEAKDSSAIENIITTHDDIYKEELNLDGFKSLNAKEVQNYISALKKGYALISRNKTLTNNDIIEIQSVLEKNTAGFRKLPGTALKNATTGETVYTPPQEYSEIIDLMTNLERFINDDTMSDFDPLVKMAIIHYQFESIHPFYDGNGRIARAIGDYAMLVHGCYYDVIMTDYRDHYMDSLEECTLFDVTPLRSFLEFSYQETLERISGFFTLVEQENMLG